MSRSMATTRMRSVSRAEHPLAQFVARILAWMTSECNRLDAAAVTSSSGRTRPRAALFHAVHYLRAGGALSATPLSRCRRQPVPVERAHAHTPNSLTLVVSPWTLCAPSSARRRPVRPIADAPHQALREVTTISGARTSATALRPMAFLSSARRRARVLTRRKVHRPRHAANRSSSEARSMSRPPQLVADSRASSRAPGTKRRTIASRARCRRSNLGMHRTQPRPRCDS